MYFLFLKLWEAFCPELISFIWPLGCCCDDGCVKVITGIKVPIAA